VLQELIDLAKDVRAARRRGEDEGLSQDEIAFYDALAESQSAVELMGNDSLKVIAHELLVSLKGSVTVDWSHRESARARMRVMVKRILRKYGYPPDLQEAAVQTVLRQAEALSAQWALWSVAALPAGSLKGLRVYLAEGDVPPGGGAAAIAQEILDATGHRRMADRDIGRGHTYAGRHRPRLLVSAALFRGARALAWLVELLDDFHRPWPTDEDIYVDFVRDGLWGNGAAHMGNARWRRLTEERAGSAKSVFHFDVQGTVAKSTHAGIPWLLHACQHFGDRVHFWPFDGWAVPAGRSVMPKSIRRCGAVTWTLLLTRPYCVVERFQLASTPDFVW
jgi:hypothetical protein